MVGLENERILGIRKQEITPTCGLRYTMATMARKKVGVSLRLLTRDPYNIVSIAREDGCACRFTRAGRLLCRDPKGT